MSIFSTRKRRKKMERMRSEAGSVEIMAKNDQLIKVVF